MVELASKRLSSFGQRADVSLSDGAPPTEEPAAAYDRFLSTFVLDLLSSEDISGVINQAYRMLRPRGLLGLASLTLGFTLPTRLFGWIWARLYAVHPSLVGGCRPLDLPSLLSHHRWQIRHEMRVTRFAIPLQVVVAQRSDAAA